MLTLFTRLARLSRRGKLLLGVAGVLLVVAIVVGGLLAFDTHALTRITRALPGLTINGCEIMPGTQCSNANLSNATLKDVNLSNANLSGANLTNANLLFANLAGANLADTDLTDVFGLQK